MANLAYGQGHALPLTGKYRSGQAPPPDSRAAQSVMGGQMDIVMSDATLEAVDRLRPIAEQAGRSMAELAPAWVLRRSEVASAIVGAWRPERVHANAETSGIELSPDTSAAIDEALGDAPVKAPMFAPGARAGVRHR
jgi:aryl-alcohol dehydrogenase-like predicted oxidoreductase